MALFLNLKERNTHLRNYYDPDIKEFFTINTRYAGSLNLLKITWWIQIDEYKLKHFFLQQNMISHMYMYLSTILQNEKQNEYISEVILVCTFKALRNTNVCVCIQSRIFGFVVLLGMQENAIAQISNWLVVLASL